MTVPRHSDRLVLYVEDDPDHADLVLGALERLGVECRIEHVLDGEAALDYLAQHSASQHDRPYLVLLDLRLPKIDGFEVLHQLKSDEKLSDIPVVVLTTSGSASDIARAYAERVNGYIVKPDDLNRLDCMLKALGTFWLNWNVQPDAAQPGP